jgi:hypothetical protein
MLKMINQNASKLTKDAGSNQPRARTRSKEEKVINCSIAMILYLFFLFHVAYPVNDIDMPSKDYYLDFGTSPELAELDRAARIFERIKTSAECRM